MSENDENKELVSAGVAEAEFQRFADEMDIDVDTTKMDADDVADFDKLKKQFVKQVIAGHLTVNENGEPTYTPYRPGSRKKDPITFRERSGASMMAMDGKKKGEDMKRMYAAMADMTKTHSNVFSGLVGQDIKTCEVIFTLLMV